MSVLRGAALGRACLLAFAPASAGAILDVDISETRVHRGTVTTTGTEGSTQWAGFCAMAATTDPTGQLGGTGPDYFFGVTAGAVVDAPPSGAQIECEVRVNGVPAKTVYVVPAGAAYVSHIQYVATDSAYVEICAIVTISFSHTTCSRAPEQGVPPSGLVGLVNIALREIDPILCPVLVTLDPVVTLPGLLDIDPQSDVYLLGDRLYDCPPYGF